jgi:hypothetical protein
MYTHYCANQLEACAQEGLFLSKCHLLFENFKIAGRLHLGWSGFLFKLSLLECCKLVDRLLLSQFEEDLRIHLLTHMPCSNTNTTVAAIDAFGHQEILHGKEFLP